MACLLCLDVRLCKCAALLSLFALFAALPHLHIFLCSPVLSLTPHNSIAIIRIDRPDKRNALTVKMLASLRQTIANTMSAHAVVLSGTGDVFCSGFDMIACRDDESVLPQLLEGLAQVTRDLRDHPAPIIISAHGAAIAGGCALLAAADFSITNAASKIGYPVVRLGISPAVSAPHLFTKTSAGSARVRQLDPALISGTEAHALGLVTEVLPTIAECEPRAIALAESLAQKPRHALAYTKRWLNELDNSSDIPTLTRALNASLSIANSPEQKQLVAQAFKT